VAFEIDLTSLACVEQESTSRMNNRSLRDVKCFLLDMDGTFFLGSQLIDGSLRFIDRLKELNIDYLFLSNNSSRHARQYAEKITKLGLPISAEKILTSGEATALYLQQEYPSSSCYVVGTPALEEEFRQHGFPLEQNHPECIILGFDTTFTYEKLSRLCDFVRAGLPYIATHPDVNCPTETGFIPDIGATIAFVRASTGREPDVIVGKPNRIIVEAAARRLGFTIEEMAMVGDRLYTDIALGETSGITTCLVLSGETRLEDLAASPHQPTYVFDNLGGIADWLGSHFP
jgi:HAD superfamily hydrolase (TIGR01457 family)